MEPIQLLPHPGLDWQVHTHYGVLDDSKNVFDVDVPDWSVEFTLGDLEPLWGEFRGENVSIILKKNTYILFLEVSVF